jgi:hypothetical protein
MRSLLIVVTVVAIVSPLVPQYGPVLATVFFALDLAVVPVWLGAAALYSRGVRQTFFLGAFAASVVSLVSTGVGFRGDLGGAIVFAVLQLLTCGVCGFVAVAARRFVERRGWHLPDDASP